MGGRKVTSWIREAQGKIFRFWLQVRTKDETNLNIFNALKLARVTEYVSSEPYQCPWAGGPSWVMELDTRVIYPIMGLTIGVGRWL